MKAPRFAGIGGHHSHSAGTVEWLTPPEILAALGRFDLDPCAPIDQPYPTADRTFTRIDNGLMQRWAGRVWLNPPYSTGQIEKWLARMAEHDFGTALIFARTETDAFFRYVWERASALLFMRGRINFHLPDGSRASGNAGAPTVLCAYGTDDADVLAACKIGGQFVPLRIPRSFIVSIFPTTKEGEKIDMTWAEALSEFFQLQAGPVALDAIYRHFSSHPKANGRRNFDAKLRQQLQRGPYRRVGRGLWEIRKNGEATKASGGC